MIQKLTPFFTAILKPLNRFKILLFIIIVAALYGYLVMQITNASNAQPSADQTIIGLHVTPRIDSNLIDKLQQLQDNSVSVQALFNDARTNPFQQD